MLGGVFYPSSLDDVSCYEGWRYGFSPDTIVVGSRFVVPAVTIAVDDWFAVPVVGILDIVTAPYVSCLY